jgi:tetratricopeptide (TPR) repeat protein
LLLQTTYIYMDVGDLETAESLLARARAVDLPDDPGLERADMALAGQRGNWTRAGEAIDRALEIQPQHTSYLANRARVDLMMGKADKAAADMETLLQEGPVAARVLTMLAYSYCALGRYEDALEPAERALAMKPYVPTYELLAWVLIAGELDIDRGVELARQSLTLRKSPTYDRTAWPYRASAEHCLGLAALERGDYTEATKWLTAALKSRPQRTLIADDLARARARATQ